MDRYDGEILHNDHSLELLVNKLRELRALQNTLIIVVSDHGEEFWDHGWTAHGHSLYQELAHCVFVMWNPHLLPTPRRIDNPVQLIDVMPTVLDLMGVKIPPDSGRAEPCAVGARPDISEKRPRDDVAFRSAGRPAGRTYPGKPDG